MKLLKWLYEKKNKKPAPYYYDYSIFIILMKPIRKWLTNTLAANCPFNYEGVYKTRRYYRWRYGYSKCL